MPNYRNKNRNRNKNKQRYKQQQQQQQQQEQQKQKSENSKKESEEASFASTSAPTNTTASESQISTHPLANEVVTDASAVYSENSVTDVDASATDKSNELDVCENVQSLTKIKDATTATTDTEPKTKTTVTTTETNDTVLYEPSQCDNKSENIHAACTDDIMGNEKSKIINNQRESVIKQSGEEVQHQTEKQTALNVPIIQPNTSALGKVIVHRIVCEDSNNLKINKEDTSINDLTKNDIELNKSCETEIEKSVNVMTQELLDKEKQSTQKPCKVMIHKIARDKGSENQQQDNDQLSQQQKQQQVKVIIHKVVTPNDDSETQEDNNKLASEADTDDNISKHQGVKVIDQKEQQDSNQLVNETGSNDNLSDKHKVKVIVHQVDRPNNDCIEQEINRMPSNGDKHEEDMDTLEKSCKMSQNFPQNDNVIVHNMTTTPNEDTKVLADVTQPPQQHQAKVIVHKVHVEDTDEQPKITSPTMREPTLTVAKPTTSEVRIVEISDESLSDLEELRSPVVSEAESSIEYSDEAQKVSDSIIEVSSSSSSSSTSTTCTQKQSRKQKRIALEHHFLPQMLNPRFLDSISEENSELSDNSENPLSRSASTDSATTNQPPIEDKVRKLNAKYPKSSLDFSKPHKQPSYHKKHSKVIREEPVAIAVATRLQDAPIADESCSTVRSCMSPEAQAAEVVFINSASSSMTDLHDMESFENTQTPAQEFILDSDLKDIVNKPVTAGICFKSLTSSVSPPSSSPPQTTTFTAKVPQQQLPEFLTKQSNNCNNYNQIINNSKLINKNTTQTPHTPSATATATTIKTTLNTNSATDSILLPSSLSSTANDQLVFAQIEEQISSVLSSINEVATHNTNTTTASTTSTTTSSPSLSSSLKIHTNFSNTQQWPVTTTSKTASTRILETSCEKSLNANSSLCTVNNAKTPRVYTQDVNMNTVRDILINNNKNNANGITEKLNGNIENGAKNGYVKLNYNNSNTFTPIPLSRESPSPPAIPPPSHEHFKEQSDSEYNNNLTSAVPSSTSNSASSFTLPLLQNNVDYHNYQIQAHNDYPKSLNSAIDPHTSFDTRHNSLDSYCSDSTNLSQCTAINVASEQSDKCDLVPTSSISDLKTHTTQHSHSSDNSSVSAADPKKLRILCTETLASCPYGGAVLEELASVAQSIGETGAFQAATFEKNMPYPLPELPHIDDLQLSLEVGKSVNDKSKPPEHDQSWLGVPTNSDPKVLVCLSPSQRSYIQQKPEHQPDDLLDAHQKFVDRRGYHEYTKEQLQLLEKEKLAEQELLQTAAIMKKLRKSITPPPPQIPPPPVPVKSSETATKAQNLSKRTVTTRALTNTQEQNNDVNTIHEKNKQNPTTSNGEYNGEENKHRLLSIMQDTSESISNKQKHSVSSSSSYENNSRQTTNGVVSDQAKEQVPTATSAFDSSTSRNSYQFIQASDHKGAGNMQSVEATLGQMFPRMGSSNIFDQEHKRFSNIEASSTSEPFCSQILNTQPKRYSSIETHSYETQKRTENGKVLEDVSTSKHETKTTGHKPDDLDNFPLATALEQDNSSLLRTGKANHRNDQEIMSDFILNKHSSEIERKQQKEITIKTTTTETSQNNNNCENKSITTNEKETEKSIPTRRVQDTYEEFRQRAKAAADAASISATPNAKAATVTTEKVTSNGDNNNNGGGETISSSMSSESTTTATTQHYKTTTIPNYDHEKLFKEFDDLSKQLNRELETSKAERQQREKSASMFDLNRVHLTQKQQIEEFNRRRHEHFKELEQEIERSMRSRSLKFTRPQEPARDTVDHQAERTYNIPIQIENGNSTPLTTKTTSTDEEAPPVPKPPKTYQIPIQIQIENVKSQSDDECFRKAESMFNINDGRHHRQRRHSNQIPIHRAEDDWSKYAYDFGSSENIVRPFAKEVEICYQRRPAGIRAPRLTVSTNDLSFNNQHSYDQFNAYNVRRHHAPMLNGAPEQNRPKFGSCYSMIERDPNPKYISTTTRRGVSPAPQPSGYFNLEGCHVKEEDMRQRRASLPREIHEQQLKYIASKEEALRTEFERLQSERMRLMKEAQKAQTMQMDQTLTMPISPTRPLRDHYRSNQKLPTLTEDEVFRQQMAEEWLNKVAEREKRRLQNIIKISKIHQDEATAKHKADMGEEFLSRVKERRHKLAMPADSDWESGAESQPTAQAQLSEAEDVPPIKIIEGEKEANLRRLPAHLREFAKFSNHQSEKIEGGHREEHQEEERSEETTDNSVSRAFKKSSMVKTVKTLRAPILAENHGHGRNQFKPINGYQSEPEPNCDSDYSTIKYRAVNPNRLQSVSSALNVRKSNETLYGTLPHPVKSDQNSYKNQPGRIEDYVTGHSSVSEKEKKEWWDEIMDIFNVQLDQSKLSPHYTEGNLSRALAKESGYTSDSNLVFRKKEVPQSSPLSPVEQKLAYKNVQAGGEPPLFGFRKPAPEKSKDYEYPSPQLPPPPKGELLEKRAVSPNRYYESDVNIHFKTPVRQEFKYPLSEEELAIRQAEQMQKLYQEERRRKYLQELQDMNARRHTDNFTPSQKSPIPLNRYDDFPADLAPKTSNQVKSIARALYNFQAQNSKELSFKKGDIIYVKRAIDKNWYEGEHNAMIGLFPANYVEIINKETEYPRQPQANVYRKPSEGQARAKYNFQAQSGVELSLNKGELVALTRRVDDNWFEGRIANRKGIFPVSYVEVLTDIGAEDIAARTTTIQQASLVNARPSLDALRTNINNEFNTLTRNGNQPPNAILRETRNAHKTDILHVDTSSEPLVYRALYKYRPQNSDELELQEGDIVHVLEKCDDGWYVGTSQRTGCFGTFPGNYVERV